MSLTRSNSVGSLAAANVAYPRWRSLDLELKKEEQVLKKMQNKIMDQLSRLQVEEVMLQKMMNLYGMYPRPIQEDGWMEDIDTSYGYEHEWHNMGFLREETNVNTPGQEGIHEMDEIEAMIRQLSEETGARIEEEDRDGDHEKMNQIPLDLNVNQEAEVMENEENRAAREAVMEMRRLLQQELGESWGENSHDESIEDELSDEE